MPKTMHVLAFALSLAAAGAALSAPPVTSKEFAFDEKTNAELARRLKIPVYFAVPASARGELPKTIDTTDRLVDFKHPDAKGSQGDVGLRLVVAKRAGLFLCELHALPGTCGESFEHVLPLLVEDSHRDLAAGSVLLVNRLPGDAEFA